MGLIKLKHPKQTMHIISLTLFLGILAVGSSDSDSLNSTFSCPEYNLDFDGHDLGYLYPVDSWQNCGEICADVTGCVAWTLGNRRCNVKTSTHGATYYSGAISGLRHCAGLAFSEEKP